jgi:hypothetical protein
VEGLEALVDRLKNALHSYPIEAAAAAAHAIAMTFAHFCPIYDQKVNFL